MSEAQRHDLTRIVLMVLFIGGLIAAAFWVLRPFIGAIVWAVMIVVATWPLMRQAQGALWGKRWLAVTAMTIVLLLVLIVPLSAAIGTVVANADLIAGWAKHLRDLKLPSPPSWLASVPFVGESAVNFWQEMRTQGVESIADDVAPYAGALTKWFVSQIGTVGGLFIQFLLTVVAAAVMYSNGEEFARWALRFGARLGCESGEGAVRLSAQSIRGVALGVVVTALVQALVGGTGLVIAGVPFAAVLCAVMFMLCVAQLGPGFVLVPAVVWMYLYRDATLATILLILSVIALTLDNFLRPFLIKKGAADLPLLLILAGVIGGLIAFGLIGIFLGPTILAVGYTLLRAWIAEGDATD